MKEIKAIIRPNKLASDCGMPLWRCMNFPGMTVSKVEGCSAPNAASLRITISRMQLTDYTPKVRIEIVAPDEVAQVDF
jgi:nitrogen regulatory protein P-II 1